MANKLAHLFKYNKEVLKKFESVESKEDALSVIQEYITDYTEDALLKDVQSMQNTLVSEGSINVEELASVTGGAFVWSEVSDVFKTYNRITDNHF